MPKRLYKEDITENDTLSQTSSNLSVRKVKKPNLGERDQTEKSFYRIDFLRSRRRRRGRSLPPL